LSEESFDDFTGGVAVAPKKSNPGGKPGRLNPGRRAGLRPDIPDNPGKLRKGFKRFWL
jgi:hypothetical protein